MANQRQDLMRVTADYEIVKSALLRTTSEAAERTEHWDAIQIIPRNYPAVDDRIVLPLAWRPQYALADVFGVVIAENIIIESSTARQQATSLQGITSFDGILRGITVRDNLISVGSTHEITLHGVVGGEIRGNSRVHVEAVSPPASNPLIVRLRPALVGGAPKGLLLTSPDLRCQMHVLSWKQDTVWQDTGEAIEYAPIVGGAPNLREGFALSAGQLVIDQRSSMCGSKQDRYLFNLDLPALQLHMLEHLPKAAAYYASDVDSFCGWLQQEACMFADVVSGDDTWTKNRKIFRLPPDL